VAAGQRIDCTAALPLNAVTTGQFAQLFIPEYYVPPPDGGYTLVVHLHSASWAAEDAVHRARASTVLFTIHLGALSSPYQSYFSRPDAFRQILDTVASVLRQRNIVATPGLRRLLVSSFSAGYAGVREILRSAEHYGSIDALMLADGLHSSLDSALMKSQLQDFVRYAREARERTKVFLLTHSSIPTSGYRSTTETANYLLENLPLPRREVAGNDEIGTLVSVADTGSFRLRGYAGETASDHMNHLYGLHLMVSQAMELLAGGPTGVREDCGGDPDWSMRASPNPFNGMTVIRLRAPWACQLHVHVFDVAGGEVATLWNGRQETGEAVLRWDARNVASGMYVVRASAEGIAGARYRTSGRVLLLR
jgi:hypothetical protein